MAMALQRKAWTRRELDRLPDDGNRYEVVNGELFVTPAPAPTHETVVVRLMDLLRDYAATHRLGQVSAGWRLIFRGSSVEPDLTVGHIPRGDSWDDAPTPALVVEVLSRTTRGRDRVQKRALYLQAGVQEYWMVDRERLCITVARAGCEDTEVFEMMDWRPRDGVGPLRFDVREVFRPFEQNQG